MPDRPRPCTHALMRTASLFLGLAAGLATASCAAPSLPLPTSNTSSVSTEAPELALGPNDVLVLFVPQRPEFSSEAGYRISPAGSISLPIVGDVRVAGRTIEEARQLIETELSEVVRDPSVGISVLEFGAHQIYVLGEVALPGAVLLDRKLTALAALSLARGLTDGARRDRVALLRRHGPDDLEVYYFDAETPGLAALVQLRPEDVIFVPRSGGGVFRDEVLPVLQGIGFTSGQIAAVAVAADQL